MKFKNKLRIGLPSKGRLRKDMEKLFLDKNITFENLVKLTLLVLLERNISKPITQRLT